MQETQEIWVQSRWGRSPGLENGNPLQYSCLENPMDRGAWRAIVHGVTKSRTELSTCMHAYRSFYFCPWETTQPQRQSLKMWVRSHHAFVHSCPNAINFTQCKRQSLHHVSIITHRLTKSSFQPPPFPYLTTVLLFSFSLYCSFVSSTFFQQARDAPNLRPLQCKPL